jgi:MraZ protein
LRLPAKFRRDLPETEDDTYYVTSDDGQCAQIYPIPVWEKVACKFQESPRMDPAKIKLQRLTSYYGLLTQMDPQGRILIPQSLREDAQISGDVIVIGKSDHLEVWNDSRKTLEFSSQESECSNPSFNPTTQINKSTSDFWLLDSNFLHFQTGTR